jgi:hypothetical protein
VDTCRVFKLLSGFETFRFDGESRPTHLPLPRQSTPGQVANRSAFIEQAEENYSFWYCRYKGV